MDVHIDDPRYEQWQVVHQFEDVATASAFLQQLHDQGVEAALTADYPPDRFGRGDIYLSVPEDRFEEAEELIEWPEQ